MGRAAMLAIDSTRWDEELTELDLDLDDALIELPQRVTVVRVETRPAQDDDDLPMLDPSEFVAALSLEDVQEAARRRPLLRKTLAATTARPRTKPKARPKAERKAQPPSELGRSWVYAIAPWAAIVFAAWAFRVELVRFLGLI